MARSPLDPELRAALAGAGQRITRQRVAVVEALAAADHPLSADQITRASKLAQSTVYRILAELCDSGVAARVSGPSRTDRYELSERLTRRHHHHLVCAGCGAVSDFDPSPTLEAAIHAELAAVRNTDGFAPSSHVFDVHGRCANCPAVS
jgi:Fur family transcriptional regulator, ferric uptake regulator